MPDFFELVRAGKEQRFLKDIDKININETNELGRSFLHIAIANGRKGLIATLISKGASVDIQDKQNGYTPLHVAAEYSDVDSVTTLLNAGASPNLVDRHGNSPLWTAVFRSRASSNGFQILKLLLDAGANPGHRNKAGRSPLDMAKQLEDESIVALLTSNVMTKDKRPKSER
jgi:ankyrin repeat protein